MLPRGSHATPTSLLPHGKNTCKPAPAQATLQHVRLVRTCPQPTLMPPLPMSVAPKNSQKGIRKWPQQMPHRSKAALGYAASSRIPQKPCACGEGSPASLARQPS